MKRYNENGRIKAIVNSKPETGFERSHPVEIHLNQGGTVLKIALTGPEAQKLTMDLKDILYNLMLKHVEAQLLEKEAEKMVLDKQ